MTPASFPGAAPRLLRPALTWGAVLAVVAATSAPARAVIIPKSAAQAAGLTRAWTTQAALDPATQRVVGAVLDGPVLLLLTSGGSLQALDSETGSPLWRRRLEPTSVSVSGPTVGYGLVAATVGPRVHVYYAQTGAPVLRESRERRKPEAVPPHVIEGAAGGAVAVGPDYLYVPLLHGKLAAYPLGGAFGLRFHVASPGQLIDPPHVFGDRVVWQNASGVVYGASASTGAPVFKFRATASLAGGPVASVGDDDEDLAFWATRDGEAYGFDVTQGQLKWRHPLGARVREQPTALPGSVYFGDQTPRLTAFDSNSGARSWSFDGPNRFVSASADRLYALGEGGELVALDRASGRPLAGWPPLGRLAPVPNAQTDRLYFVSESGLVQCLRESGLETPYIHGAPAPPVEEAVEADAGAPPADSEPPAGLDPVELPPELDEAPADLGDDLLDDAVEDPAADEGDDPFADGLFEE